MLYALHYYLNVLLHRVLDSLSYYPPSHPRVILSHTVDRTISLATQPNDPLVYNMQIRFFQDMLPFLTPLPLAHSLLSQFCPDNHDLPVDIT